MKKFIFFMFLLFITNLHAEILYHSPVDYKTFNIFDTANYKTVEIISRQQALSDLNDFIYILSSSYAGYDDMIENSFDTTILKNKFIDLISQKNTISTKDFYNFLIENTAGYINDAHFALILNNKRTQFCKKTEIHYSNTYLQYKNDSFYVFETDTPLLEINTKYTDSTANLFIYKSKGQNIYRVGVLSNNPISQKDFSFNNKLITLDLHNDGAIEVRLAEKMKYHEIETAKSGYVSISGFMPADNDSIYKKGIDIVLNKYSNLSSKWNKKKNIVIDIRANSGGYPVYSALFLYSLYDNNLLPLTRDNRNLIINHFNYDFNRNLYIDSPVSAFAKLQSAAHKNQTDAVGYYTNFLSQQQHNPARLVYTADYNSYTKRKRPYYKGKIIILTDRNTVSAGEETVAIAKKLFEPTKQLTIIGENTSGMYSYFDVFAITLPNSNIILSVPFAKNIQLENDKFWNGEGFGYYPDTWSEGKDLNNSIISITKDKELFEKLKNIESGLQ